jgi:hypothetical protein
MAPMTLLLQDFIKSYQRGFINSDCIRILFQLPEILNHRNCKVFLLGPQLHCVYGGSDYRILNDITIWPLEKFLKENLLFTR